MAKKIEKKLIWAIDPYGEAKIQSSAASLAKALDKKIDVEVVYIHGRSGFPFGSNEEAVRSDLSGAEQRIRKMLTDLKFKPHKTPRILAHNSEFVRTDVKTLVSYANREKADAILVSTNARAGFARQLLGSFAETLILESSIPTMIVNPKAKVESKPGTILFPTDFSELSWKAFQEVVSFAKVTNARVRIFHRYQGEVQSVPREVRYYRSSQWLEGDRLLDNELHSAKLKLKKWLKWAKKQQVKCDHVIRFGIKNVADATLEEARKEKIWIIAMATVTGPMTARFLGSNARWIVRAAQCPVWVLYVHGK